MNDSFLRQHAVYQVYPLSFCDTNNDGIGDLKGIISKLDYLQQIGIKIIWLSPIYESPMCDMGYDIKNYTSINPMFGTMDDFDELMREATKRGIKIVMDLVVNHTSDQHPWFQEALKDKNSPYRNYYIFMKGKKDENGHELPPNNWESNFTGSAWEKVEGEDNTYYLHLFSKQQPDLNWHNEALIQEVEKILTFWMDKGVYGFRCDVISEIYKESYEDGKKSKLGVSPVGYEHYLATKGNHDILKRLRKEVVEPRHGVLIGECGGGITTEDGKKFLDNELDTFFQFDTVTTYKSTLSNIIDMEKFKKEIIHWQKEVDWNGNYLENHDQRRTIGKFVSEAKATEGATMLLTLLYTLRGTPFIYMGQEIGMRNYAKPIPKEFWKDPVTTSTYNIARKFLLPKFLCRKIAFHFGREDERAPMTWTAEKGHGFTGANVTPWMPFNNYSNTINVETELKDENSILHHFMTLNKLREETPALIEGDIKFLPDTKHLLSYTRTYEGKTYLIVLNFSDKKRKFPKDILALNKDKVYSNYQTDTSYLRPYEANVYLVK